MKSQIIGLLCAQRRTEVELRSALAIKAADDKGRAHLQEKIGETWGTPSPNEYPAPNE
jgi:hypothetical protein